MGAAVNLTTKKIVGCRKNSFAYWHERAHLIYNDSEEGIRRCLRGEMGFRLAVLLIAFGVFWMKNTLIFGLAYSFVVYYFYTWLYEEMFCNRFARGKRKGKKFIK